MSDLKTLAEAVAGWGNCTEAWLDTSEDDAAAIAVFRSEFCGKLDAVFGATTHTKQLIASRDKTYIGTFDKLSDMDAVVKKLGGMINK